MAVVGWGQLSGRFFAFGGLRECFSNPVSQVPHTLHILEHTRSPLKFYTDMLINVSICASGILSPFPSLLTSKTCGWYHTQYSITSGHCHYFLARFSTQTDRKLNLKYVQEANEVKPEKIYVTLTVTNIGVA